MAKTETETETEAEALTIVVLRFMLNVLLPNCEQDSFMFQHIELHETEPCHSQRLHSERLRQTLKMLMPWPSTVPVLILKLIVVVFGCDCGV